MMETSRKRTPGKRRGTSSRKSPSPTPNPNGNRDRRRDDAETPVDAHVHLTNGTFLSLFELVNRAEILYGPPQIRRVTSNQFSATGMCRSLGRAVPTAVEKCQESTELD
ncbi:MAG: hypothetical protein GY820_03340 [Gammaproteobacteria bacterium]|nr:hypothetical protein [Gammaproteobacteria bacterium]